MGYYLDEGIQGLWADYVGTSPAEKTAKNEALWAFLEALVLGGDHPGEFSNIGNSSVQSRSVASVLVRSFMDDTDRFCQSASVGTAAPSTDSFTQDGSLLEEAAMFTRLLIDEKAWMYVEALLRLGVKGISGAPDLISTLVLILQVFLTIDHTTESFSKSEGPAPRDLNVKLISGEDLNPSERSKLPRIRYVKGSKQRSKTSMPRSRMQTSSSTSALTERGGQRTTEPSRAVETKTGALSSLLSSLHLITGGALQGIRTNIKTDRVSHKTRAEIRNRVPSQLEVAVMCIELLAALGASDVDEGSSQSYLASDQPKKYSLAVQILPPTLEMFMEFCGQNGTTHAHTVPHAELVLRHHLAYCLLSLSTACAHSAPGILTLTKCSLFSSLLRIAHVCLDNRDYPCSAADPAGDPNISLTSSPAHKAPPGTSLSERLSSGASAEKDLSNPHWWSRFHEAVSNPGHAAKRIRDQFSPAPESLSDDPDSRRLRDAVDTQVKDANTSSRNVVSEMYGLSPEARSLACIGINIVVGLLATAQAALVAAPHQAIGDVLSLIGEFIEEHGNDLALFAASSRVCDSHGKESFHGVVDAIAALVVTLKEVKVSYLHRVKCVKLRHRGCDYQHYLHHHHNAFMLPHGVMDQWAGLGSTCSGFGSIDSVTGLPTDRTSNQTPRPSRDPSGCAVATFSRLLLQLLSSRVYQQPSDKSAHPHTTQSDSYISYLLHRVATAGVCCCMDAGLVTKALLYPVKPVHNISSVHPRESQCVSDQSMVGIQTESLTTCSNVDPLVELAVQTTHEGEYTALTAAGSKLSSCIDDHSEPETAPLVDAAELRRLSFRTLDSCLSALAKFLLYQLHGGDISETSSRQRELECYLTIPERTCITSVSRIGTARSPFPEGGEAASQSPLCVSTGSKKRLGGNRQSSFESRGGGRDSGLDSSEMTHSDDANSTSDATRRSPDSQFGFHHFYELVIGSDDTSSFLVLRYLHRLAQEGSPTLKYELFRSVYLPIINVVVPLLDQCPSGINSQESTSHISESAPNIRTDGDGSASVAFEMKSACPGTTSGMSSDHMLEHECPVRFITTEKGRLSCEVIKHCLLSLPVLLTIPANQQTFLRNSGLHILSRCLMIESLPETAIQVYCVLIVNETPHHLANDRPRPKAKTMQDTGIMQASAAFMDVLTNGMATDSQDVTNSTTSDKHSLYFNKKPHLIASLTIQWRAAVQLLNSNGDFSTFFQENGGFKAAFGLLRQCLEAIVTVNQQDGEKGARGGGLRPLLKSLLLACLYCAEHGSKLDGKEVTEASLVQEVRGHLMGYDGNIQPLLLLLLDVSKKCLDVWTHSSFGDQVSSAVLTESESSSSLADLDIGYEADCEDRYRPKRSKTTCHASACLLSVGGSRSELCSLCYPHVLYLSLELAVGCTQSPSTLTSFIVKVTALLRSSNQNVHLALKHNVVSVLLKGFRYILISSNLEQSGIKTHLLDLLMLLLVHESSPENLRDFLSIVNQSALDSNVLRTFTQIIQDTPVQPTYYLSYPLVDTVTASTWQPPPATPDADDDSGFIFDSSSGLNVSVMSIPLDERHFSWARHAGRFSLSVWFCCQGSMLKLRKKARRGAREASPSWKDSDDSQISDASWENVRKTHTRPEDSMTSNYLHLVSIGNTGLSVEFWVSPAHGHLLYRVLVTGRVATRGVFSSLLGSNVWQHLLMTVRFLPKEGRSEVQITALVDGTTEKTESTRIADGDPAFLQKAAGGRRGTGNAMIGIGQGTSPAYSKEMAHCGTVILCRGSAEFSPGRLLHSLGPDRLILSRCETSLLEGGGREGEEDESELDALRKHLGLAFSPQLLPFCHAYDDLLHRHESSSIVTRVLSSLSPMSSPDDSVRSGLPMSLLMKPEQVSAGVDQRLRSRRKQTVFAALEACGGTRALLVLFAKVVGRNSSDEDQARCLAALLKAKSYSYERRREWINLRGNELIAKALASKKAAVGHHVAKALLNEAFEFILRLTQPYTGKTDARLSDVVALRVLLLDGRVWERSSAARWRPVFETLSNCVSAGNPMREENMDILLTGKVVETLVRLPQERIQDNLPPLPSSITNMIVSVLRDVAVATPSLDLVTYFCRYILLLHPAALTFMQSQRTNLYFSHQWVPFKSRLNTGAGQDTKILSIGGNERGSDFSKSGFPSPPEISTVHSSSPKTKLANFSSDTALSPSGDIPIDDTPRVRGKKKRRRILPRLGGPVTSCSITAQSPTGQQTQISNPVTIGIKSVRIQKDSFTDISLNPDYFPPSWKSPNNITDFNATSPPINEEDLGISTEESNRRDCTVTVSTHGPESGNVSAPPLMVTQQDGVSDRTLKDESYRTSNATFYVSLDNSGDSDSCSGKSEDSDFVMVGDSGSGAESHSRSRAETEEELDPVVLGSTIGGRSYTDSWRDSEDMGLGLVSIVTEVLPGLSEGDRSKILTTRLTPAVLLCLLNRDSVPVQIAVTKLLWLTLDLSPSRKKEFTDNDLHLLLSSQFYQRPSNRELVNLVFDYLFPSSGGLSADVSQPLWERTDSHQPEKFHILTSVVFMSFLEKLSYDITLFEDVARRLDEMLHLRPAFVPTMLDNGLPELFCNAVASVNKRLHTYDRVAEERCTAILRNLATSISQAILRHKNQFQELENFFTLLILLERQERGTTDFSAAAASNCERLIVEAFVGSVTYVETVMSARPSGKLSNLVTDIFRKNQLSRNDSSSSLSSSSSTGRHMSGSLEVISTDRKVSQSLLQNVISSMVSYAVYKTKPSSRYISLSDHLGNRVLSVLVGLFQTATKGERASLWADLLIKSRDFLSVQLTTYVHFLMSSFFNTNNSAPLMMSEFTEDKASLTDSLKLSLRSVESFLMRMPREGPGEPLWLRLLRKRELEGYTSPPSGSRKQRSPGRDGKTVFGGEGTASQYAKNWIQGRAQWKAKLRQTQARVFHRLDESSRSIYNTAMDMTQQVVSDQNEERKEFVGHIKEKMTEGLMIKTDWQLLSQQLCHERSVWYDEASAPKSWSLDSTEGPNRERKRLKPCHLHLAERYLADAHKYKAKASEVVPPLSYLWADSGDVSDSVALVYRLQLNERISFTSKCVSVTPSARTGGELFIGETSAHFVADATIRDPTTSAQTHLGPKDAPSIKWNLREIKEIHMRRHLLKDTAVEVFLITGRTSLLAFDSTQERDSLCAHLDSLSLPNRVSVGENVEAVKRLWTGGKMTNFEYLTQLNKMAGRTFNDLMQYPAFPYVLADYSSDVLNLLAADSFRNLAKPIGAQDSTKEQRARDKYQNIERDIEAAKKDGIPPMESDPYHFSSHYSNSGTVLYYLVRLPPFTQEFLKYQDGNFDRPDRTFHSLESAWQLSSFKSPTDVKELIPEFFYLPQFFCNHEGFDLGRRQNSQPVDTVLLPPWCRRDPRLFVLVHRQALESERVTRSLHRWVDLVFGFQQTGKAAVESTNVFHPATYYVTSSTSNVEELDELSQRALAARIETYGQMPRQLFKSAHSAMEKAYCGGIPQMGDPDWEPGTLKKKKRMEKTPPCDEDSHYWSLPVEEVIGLSWGHYVGSPDCGDPVVTLNEIVNDSVHQLIAVPTGEVFGLQESTSLLVMYCKTAGITSVRTTGVNWAAILSYDHPDNVVRIKHSTSKPPLNLIRTDSKVTCTDSIPDCKLLFFGHTSGVVSVYSTEHTKSKEVLCDFKIHRLKQPLYGHRVSIATLRVCVEYSILVTCDCEGVTIIWDLNKLTYVTSYTKSDRAAIKHLSISPTLGDIATTTDLDMSISGVSSGKRAGPRTGSGQSAASAEPELGSRLELHTVNGAFVAAVETDVAITTVIYTTAPEGRSVNAVVAGLSNGSIRFWSSWDLMHIRDVRPPGTAVANDSITSLTFAHHCEKLVATTKGKRLLCWEKAQSYTSKKLSVKFWTDL